MAGTDPTSLACPVPLGEYPTILMAHGGGGRLSQQLLQRIFLPQFDNPMLGQRHDGAVLELNGQRLAFTSDSYVIHPLFFPGGDIGSLAVYGTVNDLAMCGAQPLWLSASFVLEEGLPMETLRRVVESMKRAAALAGVAIVTGDTKVVDKGKGDGLFLNTAGIGHFDHSLVIAPNQVRPGDAILLSGDLGRHGTAILSVRQGLEFETPLESDCAPLAQPVADLITAGIEVHCLRDLTRGGMASALNEIAAAAGVQVDIEGSTVPVRDEVQGACELLGLDPYYVANEGRFVAFVSPVDCDRALAVLRAHPACAAACWIGSVRAGTAGMVTVRTAVGAQRVLDLLTGEQLPRIC